MQAQKLMTLEVVTVTPELSLEVAHHLMQRRGVRHLPVIADGRLAGIVTDRDILLAAAPAAKGQIIYPQRSVGEVMSLAPISASPQTPIAELAKTMVEAKIDALPIIGANDELLGLVTATDLLLVLTALPPDSPGFAFEVRRASELAAHA